MKIAFSLYQHNTYTYAELQEVIDFVASDLGDQGFENLCQMVKAALYEYRLNMVYDTDTNKITVESVDL